MSVRNAIIASLQREQTQLEATTRRYTGLLSFFDAAIIEGDGAGAEHVRTQIHAIVDRLLDSKGSILVLAQQLTNLPPD